MTLTIIHVAPESRALASGPAVTVPTLMQYLSNAGCHCLRLYTNRPGFGLDALHGGLSSYPFATLRLSRLSPPFDRPDLLVFHGTYDPRHALLARQANRHAIPYIITPRGGMTRAAHSRGFMKKQLADLLYFSRTVRRAAAIHYLTPNEAKESIFFRQPYFVVGNGVDIPPESSLARPNSHQHLRFTFIGRKDIQHKGLDLFLQSLRIVRELLAASQVTVAIHGPDISGSEQALRHMIGAFGLQHFVRLESAVFGADKAAVLKGSDLFVLTSRLEGHPMAVLEAMAAGLPCLVTPGTNMGHDVAAFGAGWVADATPDAIAQSLTIILRQRQSLPERGYRARALVERCYRWECSADATLRHYQRIVREHSGWHVSARDNHNGL